MNADDKADEDDFENDTNEEDIVDDEDYKEKDDEDKNENDEDDVDDDDKVVKLTMKNIFIKVMIPWCWLVLTKMKMMKNYPRAKPHGCMNTSIEKIFQTRWLQPNMWITIQVPFKPNLTCYETKLKCLMLPMSSMFYCGYSNNYNIRMFVGEVVIMNKVFLFTK